MKELINLINKKLEEYMPITYPEDIFKAMKYTLMLPGKRLRPVMCIETARILGCSPEIVLPSACALEMLHVQSLIHDDLPCMDNDDFRRGQPSNHKVFGEANAVLAGDALLTFAPQLIIEKSKEILLNFGLNILLAKFSNIYTKFKKFTLLLPDFPFSFKKENEGIDENFENIKLTAEKFNKFTLFLSNKNL